MSTWEVPIFWGLTHIGIWTSGTKQWIYCIRPSQGDIMGENVTPFMFVQERGIPATISGRVHPHIFLGVKQTQGPRRSKKTGERQLHPPFWSNGWKKTYWNCSVLVMPTLHLKKQIQQLQLVSSSPFCESNLIYGSSIEFGKSFQQNFNHISMISPHLAPCTTPATSCLSFAYLI